MQACGGRGDGTDLAGVDGLVAFAISQVIGPLNVGRQRHVPGRIEPAEKVFGRRGKLDNAQAELSAREDPGADIPGEMNDFADPHLAAGANQGLPAYRVPVDLFEQHELDEAAGVFLGGGCVDSLAAPEHPCGQHA